MTALQLTYRWRCSRCARLLGTVSSGRLTIQITKDQYYITALPATTTCLLCRMPNELRMARPPAA
jgi:hypothetical protein